MESSILVGTMKNYTTSANTLTEVCKDFVKPSREVLADLFGGAFLAITENRFWVDDTENILIREFFFIGELAKT